jgi:predicted Zn-dependent protease with MMP-like domain
MPKEDFRLSDPHLTDEELLLAADGELPTRRAAQVQFHLAACWDCRARMAEVEGTIADFARAHRQTLDPQLPPIAGPRALLRAQLAQRVSEPQAGSWRRVFQFKAAVFNSGTRAAGFVGVTLFIALIVGRLLFLHSMPRPANSVVGSLERASLERGAEPNHSLTPGATRRVAISDVCARAHEEVVADVSTSLRQEVFQEYGIVNPRADDYEIDYLIAPGLGGAEDIQNLWPEPYTSQTWNARVKDALEERLHELVCTGKLDLPTAQRDIATDWIAAYKKYFHTDRPLALRSDLMQLRETHRAVGD